MRTTALIILTFLFCCGIHAQGDTSFAAKRSRFSFVVNTDPTNDKAFSDSALLADVLLNLKIGKITAFSDSECTKPLQITEVNEIAMQSTVFDTTESEDTATYEMVIAYYRIDFDFYWLHHFRFVVQAKPAMQVLSVGIDRQSSSYSLRRGYRFLKLYEPTRTMFWLRYNEVKPLFDDYVARRPGHKLVTALKDIKIPAGEFLAYPDGRKYRGELENDKPEGKGTMYYPDGDRHVGTWMAGVRNGAGMYYFFNSDSIKGNWRNDKINGNGTYYFSNGNKYEGNFVDGKFSGRGIKYYYDGAWCEGNWKDDERNGPGTYYFANGNKYVGNFVHNKFEGKGVFYYEGGDRYEGDFKEDSKNGIGSYYWTDNSRYEGAFANGLMEGFGTYVVGDTHSDEVAGCPDCVRYKGMWKNDVKSGMGKCYDKNGKLLYEGEFVNDRPVGKYPNR